MIVCIYLALLADDSEMIASLTKVRKFSGDMRPWPGLGISRPST